MKDSFFQLRDSIFSLQPQAEELLRQVVNINSYTENKKGIDEVGRVFSERFKNLNMTMQVFPRENAGDNLLFSSPAYNERGRGGFVFLSHMDTVFEPNRIIKQYDKKEGRYTGNGSCDDKGGAVIAWQALLGLKTAGLLDSIPVRVLLTTDEETGSHNSRDLIKKITSDADLVFVVEYGRPHKDGASVVTSRLGRGTLTMKFIGGKAEQALLETMEEAYLFATPDYRRVVRIKNFLQKPDHCEAKIYFGFPLESEGEYMLRILKNKIAKIMDKFKIQGSCEGDLTRPPLVFGPKHWNMIEHLTEMADRIDFKIHHEHRTSCSDGSFVSMDVPVLDGMGPIGDNVHTEDEYMTGESLTVRPLLLAGLMATIGGFVS